MTTLFKALPFQIRTRFQRKLLIALRNFVDRPTGPKKSKEVMVQGPTSLVHFRVRRARPKDMPRVISFIQQNSPLLWPGAITTTSRSHVAVITDLLSRSLSQGHTMLAEQQEANHGWSQVRGLALNTSLSPWDAMLLEKWAQCIQCENSKKLILLSAQFLRAPALHQKYMVPQVLQIVLLVPPHTPRATQVAQVLVKVSMRRGQDLGYKVLRFDVTSELVNKVLSGMKLNKELETNVNIDPASIPEMSNHERLNCTNGNNKVVVYTAFPQKQAR